jgi:5-methylcytosine-specific restriction protein A
LILRGGGTILSDEDAIEVDLEDASITEKRRYVAHRNSNVILKPRKKLSGIHGYICQACDFDFGAIYGGAAQRYIEAHHA